MSNTPQKSGHPIWPTSPSSHSRTPSGGVMTERYWRSVRFYKHLYITAFASVPILLLVAAFYFWQVTSAATKPPVERGNGKKIDVELELAAASVDSNRYSDKYPELHAFPGKRHAIAENTVYLTFDDGPSPVTSQVLDVLKRYKVKGTFFVIGERLKSAAGAETAKRIIREGHSLGMHSDTHNYRKIYASVDAWLDDFAAVDRRIRDITGQKTGIFRFPGGSINIYNANLYQEIIAEMTRRGYVYFDWNVSLGDISLSPQKAETLISNLVTRKTGDSRIVILMHDSASKTETLKALPKIIEHYRNRGFSFDSLQSNTYPITFGYRS